MTEGSSTHPKVVVVVLNWNNWKDTLLCVESIFHNKYPNYQVVVVDNDSEDGSLDHIKAWAEGRMNPSVNPDDSLSYLYSPPADKPIHYVQYGREGADEGGGAMPEAPLVLIQTGSNLGYAGGNNVAMRYVHRRDSGAYILILNNDAAITPDFLASAMGCISSGPGAGVSVLGFVAYWYHEPDRVGTAYMWEEFTRGPMFVTEVPKDSGLLVKDVMVYGGAMLISPDAPVKLFPEEYFMYCEDMDYCKQIFEQGGTVAAQIGNPVYERGGSSIGTDSPAQIYYTRRNKLVFSKKHYSTLEYSLILARMTYSTLAGCLKSAIRGERAKTEAYVLSLVHHLQGKTGRTWTQER